MEVVGEGEGEVTLISLEATRLLTREVEPSGTMLVDARNGFNELIRLEVLLTVHNCWLEGTRFAFNCCKHWAQLLIHQPGDPPVTLLIQEAVTQGDPL